MRVKVLFYVTINVQLYDLYHSWKFKPFMWHIGYNMWNLYGLMAVSRRPPSSSAAAVLVVRCPYPWSSSVVVVLVCVVIHRRRPASSLWSVVRTASEAGSMQGIWHPIYLCVGGGHWYVYPPGKNLIPSHANCMQHVYWDAGKGNLTVQNTRKVPSAAGTPPRTPLRELTALPQTP